MSAFGAISYGAAAGAFLLLTMLLVTSWQGRAQGARLIVATAMTSIWAAGLAWQAWDRSIPLVWIYTLEILRDGAWLFALTGLAHGVLPRFLAVGSQLLWIGLLLAGWALAIMQARILVDEGPGVLLAPSGLFVALAVLVALEQIYRNANATGRYGFKFLAAGLGGVFAYDLFLYSQAELLKTISEDLWLARGLVNAMLVPLIAIAARRNPHWSLDVFVSRQVVTFTTAVMAVGVYLLFMAVGGYFVRQVGGSWGAAANALFFTGALAVLAVIVLSGTVRRRLRVFVSKHFYRNKYDYRIEWLRFVETLSSSSENDIRRTSLQAIAQIFDSPGAVMYVVNDSARGFVPVAAWPMRLENLPDLEALSNDQEMVRFVADNHWVVDLREYSETPEVYQNIDVPQWLRRVPKLRVVSPLLEPLGLTGFVLLYEPPPPFELTFEDRDLLKTVGRHVATIVAQHEADRRLAESRQFEAYHRLTAFMMHDLKNAVAQLQLVVRNAEKHKHKPEFVDDAIGTIANAVERITRLIEQLRESGRRSVADEVDMLGLVRDSLARCADRRPVPTLAEAAESNVRVRADHYRLSAVLEHILRNAQDATGADGEIAVTVATGDGRVRIEVADTGCGMSPDFVRERLFRPFDSTKGSRGMGIGAYQVREYVRSLGGEVEVQSSPGSGTRFRINLPIWRGEDDSERSTAASGEDEPISDGTVSATG